MYPPEPANITIETAIQKVREIEDRWNRGECASLESYYSTECRWLFNSTLFSGQAEIHSLLRTKLGYELEVRLMLELWAFGRNKITATSTREWHDEAGEWFVDFGQENWVFDTRGRIVEQKTEFTRDRISELERQFFWPLGPRPLG